MGIFMKKQTSRRSSAVTGKKKTLYIVGAVGLLIVLFLASFWITGLVLKISQGTLFVKGNDELPEATAKPTYEQLEQMVAERDAKIQSLEIELERYRGGSSSGALSPSTQNHTVSPSTSSPSSGSETSEAPTQAPTTEVPEATPEAAE